MRRFTIAASIFALAALACAGVPARAQTVDRAIDLAHSKALFGVQHVFVERVNGSVPIVSGSVVLDGTSPIPVRVSATLDATKLQTGDSDRDASLQSPDFFDVKKYPLWTFSSTKIARTGDASFTVDGVLTMHGVAQNEQLDVTVGGTASHPTYHATAHVDRKAFGMSVSRLDPAIGNPVDVTLDIALK